MKELYTTAQETQIDPTNFNDVTGLIGRINDETLSPKKTFHVGTWKSEYRKAYIDADSEEGARTIAEESLARRRDDIQWIVCREDGGDVACVVEM